jgi:hypothetical protein
MVSAVAAAEQIAHTLLVRWGLQAAPVLLVLAH